MTGRYRACLKNDNRNILCKIVKCTPEEAVIIEVDENLERNDVTNYEERGKMLVQRKAAYEKLHPETKAGGDRKSAKVKNQNGPESIESFVDNTAKNTNLDKRTIERDIKIGSIPQEVKEQSFYDDLNKKEKLQLASNLVKEEKKSREKSEEVANQKKFLKACGKNGKPVDGYNDAEN